MMLAQARIFYAMSRDGLICKFFGRVHPKCQTPLRRHGYRRRVRDALLAGLLPIGVLGDLVSIGTLLAFATVCIGVLVLRYTQARSAATVPRSVPPGSSARSAHSPASTCSGCAFVDNWLWMSVWIVVGIVIYFAYGRQPQRAARQQQ